METYPLTYPKDEPFRRCREYIFGSGTECDLCSPKTHSNSCVTQHKDTEKLTRWYTKKTDPCPGVCTKLMGAVDVVGRGWCSKRCQKAIKVNRAWHNAGGA